MTEPLTPAARAELRALMEVATPGPWRVFTQEEWENGIDFFGRHAKGESEFLLPLAVDREDAEAIEAAMNALPALLDSADEAERLREVFRRARHVVRYLETEPDCCPSIALESMINALAQSVRAAEAAKGGER